MGNDDELMAGDPMDRLEQKIDTLTGAVDKMSTRLDGVESRVGGVESRLGGVESGLRDVKAELADVGTRLTKVETRLTKIEILADKTDAFSKNVWDSLTSLDKTVTDGFATAKKDNGEQFRLVHAAIDKWGERVEHLESVQPTVRKRQR